METMKKIGIMMLRIIMAVFMISPVMAHPEPVFVEDPVGGGNVNYYQEKPLEISLVDPIEVNIDPNFCVENTFSPVNNIDNDFSPVNNIDNDFSPVNNIDNDFSPVNDVDVHNDFNPVNNVHNDFNPDVNVHNDFNPDINVDQSQKQSQNQLQFQLQNQDQSQKQSQTQANVQTVIVPIPKGADGGLLISNSNKAPTVAQLSVGDSEQVSRLVYPGEVLTYPVKNGDEIFLRAASDVGLYTIGWFPQDDFRVGSSEATPGYDPIGHKLTFGLVVPVDKINYWTTKATLVASEEAHYVVIDNRAPRNGYTHIEVTITSGEPVEESVKELPKIVIKPNVYPVDAYGRAITS